MPRCFSNFGTLLDGVVLTEQSAGARARVPLQGQFTLAPDYCNHQNWKKFKTIKRIENFEGKVPFHALPWPSRVSSKPFSRPQKVARLNVTPTDRCSRKKVDRGGKLQKLASFGKPADHLLEKTSSGSLTGRSCSCLTRDLGKRRKIQYGGNKKQFCRWSELCFKINSFST